MNDQKINPSPEDPLHKLKEILLTEDQARIQGLEAEIRELQVQLNQRDRLIKTLEPVITDLLNNKIANSRDEMARSLAPVMSEAIKHQIHNAKEDVVDALYPIMGRMVSKSVAEAMKKIVANINERLNKTFDFNIWKQRVKAKIFGVNAGEMILADAAPFDLQRIFLIAKGSGLLISYVDRDRQATPENDAQVIGGMLTAIKSFVETAFVNSPEGDLKEIEHSDCTIRIESGRYTYLAAIYTGVPAVNFDELLQHCHHRIHAKFHRQLREYQGDNSKLSGIEGPMKELMKKVHAAQHE